MIGLCIVPVGLYLRSTLEETPAFQAESSASRAGAANPALPLAALFREYWRPLLRGFAIAILWAVAVYVLLIFMPVFVQKAFGFSAAQSFGASLVENLLFVGGCFLFGAAADRIGAERMLSVGACALLLGVSPLFLWLNVSRTEPVLILVLAGFGLLVSSYTSVAPLVLSALFPTRVRATGISITYNAAFTVFGGFAPAILTWFTGTAAGSVFAPAWYLTAAALPALIAIALRQGR